MPGGSSGVRIEGLPELQRALGKVNKEAKKQVRAALREVAEPVRDTAERLAVTQIGNIGPRWSRMRIGITPGSVYVAPASRRAGGSPRPNLGTLLFEQAMVPALDKHESEIFAAVDKTLDQLADTAGF